MKKIFFIILLTLFAVSAFAADEPKSEDQKTLYAIGLVVANQLGVFKLTPAELEFVKQGITDGVSGKTP